jgi:catechol 2,3-dioxygenase-like lactoylglutathione lyase family enzyme
MLHHLGLFASDFQASRQFYVACLGTLEIVQGYETSDIAEFWRPEGDTPSLSLERAADDVTRGVHLAFAAPTETMSMSSFKQRSRQAAG